VFKVLIRLIQKYLKYSYFFGRVVVCAKPTSFLTNRSPKNAETNFRFGGRFGVSRTGEDYWLRSTLVHFAGTLFWLKIK